MKRVNGKYEYEECFVIWNSWMVRLINGWFNYEEVGVNICRCFNLSYVDVLI